MEFNAGASTSFALQFHISDIDTYFINVEAEYVCDEFWKEYEKSQPNPQYLNQTKSYNINTNARRITRMFSKKFKFEGKLPFDISNSIYKKENNVIIIYTDIDRIYYPNYSEKYNSI